MNYKNWQINTRIRWKVYTLLLSAVVSALVLFAGCSRPSYDPGNTSKLRAIDDSIGAKSPSARAMINSAMALAVDSIDYYECAARLAKYYVISPTPDSALMWVDRIEAFCKSCKPCDRTKVMLAYAYNTKAGYYHNFHKNTGETIELYGKAYSLLMSSDNKSLAPNVCANLADAYVYENKVPDAALWYRRALFLADSLGLPAKENITLYMGMAQICQQLGDYERALSLYEKADSHFGEMSVNMRAYFLNNYGSFYYYQGDYSKALSKFLKMEKLLRHNGMAGNFDMYLCKLNLADIYLNLSNEDMAEKLLDEVEPFWRKTGDATAMYYCTTIRLGIAVGRGDSKAAEEILKTQKPQPDMIYSLRHIRNRYLRIYYADENKWHQAYNVLRADMMEEDSLEHNRMNMRAADVMAQHVQDTLRLHNNLAMEYKNAQVNRFRMWLAVALGVVVVLLLMLYLWIAYARRRSLKSQMQVMQLRLESARNRISPHFVFNVLNNKIIGSDSREADELLDMSKLIRANLDVASRLTVTLAEELDFVDKYVRVERHLLTDDDFKFTIDVADGIDAEKVVIPSMFIQLLVENSFVHALMGRDGHKELTVKVWYETGRTIVTVTDNGPGFDVRSMMSNRRTGLNIIRQTIAVVNTDNRNKIRFSLNNLTDDAGNRTGCEGRLVFPDSIKYPPRFGIRK